MLGWFGFCDNARDEQTLLQSQTGWCYSCSKSGNFHCIHVFCYQFLIFCPILTNVSSNIKKQQLEILPICQIICTPVIFRVVLSLKIWNCVCWGLQDSNCSIRATEAVGRLQLVSSPHFPASILSNFAKVICYVAAFCLRTIVWCFFFPKWTYKGV